MKCWLHDLGAVHLGKLASVPVLSVPPRPHSECPCDHAMRVLGPNT